MRQKLRSLFSFYRWADNAGKTEHLAYVTWKLHSKVDVEVSFSEPNALNNIFRNNKEQDSIVYPKYMSLESGAGKELHGLATHRFSSAQIPGLSSFWEQLDVK